MEPAKTPDNAHCRALGEGFFAVSGSDACIRISGYVAAGAEFGGGLRQGRGPAPFDSVSSTHTRVGGGVSLDARFWGAPVDLPHEGGYEVGPGRVPGRFMLGKAFFVYWPAGYRPLNGAPGLIPNFSDMRFIH